MGTHKLSIKINLKILDTVTERVKTYYEPQHNLMTASYVMWIALIFTILQTFLIYFAQRNKPLLNIELFVVCVVALFILWYIYFGKWRKKPIHEAVKIQKYLDDLFYLKLRVLSGKKLGKNEISFINQFLKSDLDYEKIKKFKKS